MDLTQQRSVPKRGLDRRYRQSKAGDHERQVADGLHPVDTALRASETGHELRHDRVSPVEERRQADSMSALVVHAPPRYTRGGAGFLSLRFPPNFFEREADRFAGQAADIQSVRLWINGGVAGSDGVNRESVDRGRA